MVMEGAPFNVTMNLVAALVKVLIGVLYAELTGTFTKVFGVRVRGIVTGPYGAQLVSR